MQAVREVETGRDCAWAVQRKYGILGNSTVMRWVRQLVGGDVDDLEEGVGVVASRGLLHVLLEA